MKLKLRKNEGVCILEMSGNLTLGPPTQELREAVKKLIGEGERIFVLDLAKARRIDSSGIGEVVACRNRVVAVEGRIRVVLDERNHDLFVLFELQKVLKLYKNVEQALASLVG